MLNLSRTPTRLDTFPLCQKSIYVFFTFWMVIFFIYAFFSLHPIIDTPEANQDHMVSYSNISDVPSSQGENTFSALIDEYYTDILERSTKRFSQFSETLINARKILIRMISPIPLHLYLHPENNLNSQFHWVPVISEEKISEDDILVDLSSAINLDLSYELSAYYKHIIGLIVERESGNQPFLGQLLVAEDVVGRIRSGLFGSDIDAILMGYLAKREDDGKLHIYLGSKEILEASPSVQEAVKLALSGSQVSYYLLQAVTELRNEQYGLQLDDNHYKWGAIYHFAPKRISNDATAVKKRQLSRIPVSFQYCEHIFYGYWLPSSAQLNL